MSRVVQCVLLKREAPGLDRPPYPGDLGRRIYESVSREACSAASVGALVGSSFTWPTLARAFVTSVNVDFSKFAAPATVLTRFAPIASRQSMTT